jgi:hypothetical protein
MFFDIYITLPNSNITLFKEMITLLTNEPKDSLVFSKFGYAFGNENWGFFYVERENFVTFFLYI